MKRITVPELLTMLREEGYELEDGQALLAKRGDAPLPTAARLFDGIAFADDLTQGAPAIWGDADAILWSPQEPLMIYGPQGVGKTTIAQRLTLARAGLATKVLGYSVQPSERITLYVAADRPAQAARSWRRMVASLSEHDRELLRARVQFWKGPLPFDPGREPERLLEFVQGLDTGTLILDSLKDLAMELAKDEVGARVNRAWQLLVAEGIEVLDLHHPRKSAPGQASKPKTLDEVYGSTWLTAGHGSVLLLWGNPGDPIVELSHLKQPMEEVGPFRVIIDHEEGTVARYDGGDVLAMLRAAPRGMAAGDAARVLFGVTKPTDAQVEKTRRRLQKLVVKDLAYATNRDGRDERGHPVPVTYFATPPFGAQEELGEGRTEG